MRDSKSALRQGVAGSPVEPQPYKPVASHVADIPRSGIRDFFEIVSSRKGVISLGIGEPDFTTPWHIREASIYALNQGETSYTSNLGLLDLRKGISEYVSEMFRAEYSPDNEILVTVGVSEALDLALRAIVEPGDEIIYHQPCYVSYSPTITLAHGIPIPVAVSRENNFRLKTEDLEKAITPRTKALIINFPTNPTGAVLTREDRDNIAGLAIENNLIVISDAIYSELTYNDEKFNLVSLPEMKDRTIFLHGFSKAWAMTGFRAGFACAPPVLIEAMMKIHQYTMLCAPILSQKAAMEALINGRKDVREMRNQYQMRRNYIHTALNEAGLPCHLPQGAFYAFPYIGDTGLTSQEFSLQLLEKENVACVPGTAFGPAGEGFLRCSFATDMEKIKEAMKRLSNFVSNLYHK